MKHTMPSLAVLASAAFLCFHMGDDLGKWVMRVRPDPDEHAWLRMEYGAGPEQLRRLASMQEGYRRRSEDRVRQVEEASRRVAAGLDRSGEFTQAVRDDLAALELARARAHELALEHCTEVARVLGPEHGPRYLREMERVLIGLAPRHHQDGGLRAERPRGTETWGRVDPDGGIVVARSSPGGTGLHSIAQDRDDPRVP